MNAATAFKALAALHNVMTTKEVHIPHALWIEVMHAHSALDCELDMEGLKLPVKQSAEVAA